MILSVDEPRQSPLPYPTLTYPTLLVAAWHDMTGATWLVCWIRLGSRDGAIINNNTA